MASETNVHISSLLLTLTENNEVKAENSHFPIKRHRTKFTSFQLRVLEREFAQSIYVNERKRSELAGFLGLTETNVQVQRMH